MHPTGRYAASISMRRYGSRRGSRGPGQVPIRTINHVAIIADESLAPEAAILETGHGPIDMLQHLSPGRSYPIFGDAQTPSAVSGASFPTSSYGRSRVRKMWAVSRQLTGFRRTPSASGGRKASNTSGTGKAWTIPAMPAYHPAQILADLVREYGFEAKVS